MITQWMGRRLLTDRQTLAELLGVSERTVRRHCHPVDYEPATGRPRGLGGRALYDAQDATAALAGVVARPTRTAALTRLRQQADQHRKEENDAQPRTR